MDSWFDDDYTEKDYQKDLEHHYDLSMIESMNIIDCIGVDGKRHRCVSWKDKTLCGKGIIKKGDNDNYDKYPYTCYECAY